MNILEKTNCIIKGSSPLFSSKQAWGHCPHRINRLLTAHMYEYGYFVTQHTCQVTLDISGSTLKIIWKCCHLKINGVLGNIQGNLPLLYAIILSWSCLIQMHISYDFNSWWPSDATWHHGSGSTLAQVMACCLTAPSHYLNLCWLIISKVHWHSHEGNFTQDTSAISH